MRISSTIALGVVSAIYCAAQWTLPPSVFWSPDEGAKFIQMHSRLMDARTPHRISYGSAGSDPLFVFYPAAQIYPRPLWPAGVQNHWPASFPLVSLPFYKLFGLRGLYVLPLACGVLAAAAVAGLARRMEPDSATPAVLLAALGAPLLFQSVLFLEHTLAGLLGLGALLCGWSMHGGSSRRRLAYALAAIACLAGLFALRDETLIFVAALVCTGAGVLTRGRIRAGLLSGILLLALLPLLTPMKTAVGAVGGTSRTAELISDATRALSGMKDPALWREFPQHVLSVLVNSPQEFGVPLSTEWALTGLLGLVLCGLSALMLPRPRFPCWLLGACLVSLASAIGLCLADRYRAVHGLLLPMPCLLLAWLPSGFNDRQPRRAERFLVTLLPVFLVIYVLVTWVLRRPAGGPEWGLRYALLAYLLAAVLGAVAVTRFAQVSRGWRRIAGLGLAVLLFALSCGYGVRGIIEVQVTKRDLRAFELELHGAGCPIVTDQWWLAAALAPTFVRSEMYTLNPGTDPGLWLNRFGPRVQSFLFVSYVTPPDTVKTAIGTTAALTQRRVIQNMTFSRFAVRGAP